MQTIDAIRRTNELSKVLKQHGFAENSFQAVNQASEALGAETAVLDYERPSVAHMPDNILQKIANLERSKHMLSGRLDAAMQAHEQTQAQLKQVLARLDSAEAKLRVLRNQPEVATTSVASSVREPAPIQGSASAPPIQHVERERHPRQAQIDEKFSIENVFYCGKR